MMFMIVGGVIVKFFVIYYNDFKFDLFMCIVFEFYFKEFVVGGFDWVFEIGCVFWNE